MPAEKEEVSGPPHSVQYRDRLESILEGELLDNRAQLAALNRCEQLSTLADVMVLLDVARDELKSTKVAERKRYLFSYVSQLERVVSQLTNERRGRYDA